MIELAKVCDIEEIYKLQKIAFQSEAEMTGRSDIPALIETFEDATKDFKNWTVLVEKDDNGKIIGSVRFKSTDEVVEIGRLMVHPQYRGKSLSTKLMTEIEKRSTGKTLELFTCIKSVTNIQLYEHFGFEKNEVIEEDGKIPIIYMRKKNY